MGFMLARPRRRRVNRRRLSPALLFVSAACLSSAALAQASRDYISIVGSSTVYPFATVVAEQFGRTSGFKTPKIEPTGSGGGFKLFCGGVGVQYPDITNASRRITASEVKTCKANGVTEIVEAKIGYDGIVVANSKTAPRYDLDKRELYLALAARVPDPSGAPKLVDNPYERWSEIDSSLPDVAIHVFGPPTTSGTRDAFLELVMDPACEETRAVATMSDADRQAACFTLREDGRYVDAGENDNLIVQKLQADPDALGIFGYSFLDQNADKIQGSRIEGVLPEFDNIADGSYPVARPLYFYVKKAHANFPGLKEYLQEFFSEAATGEFGYLSDKGLVPLPEDERREMARHVLALEPLKLDD